MKHGKRSLCILLACLILLAVQPLQAFAYGTIDTTRSVDLNICYKDEAKVIPNAEFKIYKVADVDEAAQMKLTSVFETYKNVVSGLADLGNLTQSQWTALASSLKGYVLKDELVPVAEGKTNSEGVLAVSDLEVGLYLVIGSRAVTDDCYVYSADPFMVFLPNQDPVDNVWDYDVDVSPKYSKEYVPPEDDHFVTRKVLKVWDDAGYEALRPAEVTVQLLEDGKVCDTQTLNKDNNWRYTWEKLDADHEWEVVETAVDRYAVSVTRSGVTFTVTNSYLVPIVGTNLPVQKRITGDKPNADSTFTFVFTAENASNPMPKGSSGTVKEFTITGAGSAEIGEIVFTEPGTYVYTVSEKNGGVEGYTYDSTVYTVVFEVTEQNGEIVVTKTIKGGNGDQAPAVEFSNVYKTPGNKLPQTGILWWPVPALLIAGCVLVMAGVIRRRKYNG